MTNRIICVPLAFVAYFITICQGFLLEPDECVWYGQCGPGWNRGKLNCPADGANKMAPRLTDPEGLRILRDYCPALYRGVNDTRTCCSTAQLKDIERNMGFPKTFLSHCPACFYNFVNQVCQMTCSPKQSQFVWANMTATKPRTYTTGIPSITYVMSRDFINELFESCVDVTSLFGLKAIGFLCGRKAQDCTPEIWLRYIGSVSNGQAPFPIEFVYTDGENWHAPDGKVRTPLQVKYARCNKPLSTSSTIMGNGSCSCRECRTAKPCLANPRPTRSTRKAYFDQLFGAGRYQTVQLVIQRKDSQAMIRHALPPPSVENINFTSIYDKGFLLQVLDLQNTISNLAVRSGGANITLEDVCLKVNNEPECVVESVLQYYQNNASKLDKIAYDDFHIFVLGDYLDHFTQCSIDPTVGKDALPYHMSCDTNWGGVTQPYIVLEGYKGNSDYANATSFVVTFLLKTGDSKVPDWKTGFDNFVKSYQNSNMTITYT